MISLIQGCNFFFFFFLPPTTFACVPINFHPVYSLVIDYTFHTVSSFCNTFYILILSTHFVIHYTDSFVCNSVIAFHCLFATQSSHCIYLFVCNSVISLHALWAIYFASLHWNKYIVLFAQDLQRSWGYLSFQDIPLIFFFFLPLRFFFSRYRGETSV